MLEVGEQQDVDEDLFVDRVDDLIEAEVMIAVDVVFEVNLIPTPEVQPKIVDIHHLSWRVETNNCFHPPLLNSEPQRIDHKKVLLIDLPKRVSDHFYSPQDMIYL